MTKPLMDKSLWKPCRDTVAKGLAIGMFLAVMPVPLQAIFAGLAAVRLHGNVPIAMAASWLSNPLTTPPIVLGQFWLGTKMASAMGLQLPDIPWFKRFLLWLGESEWFKIPIPESILNGNTGDFFLGTLASGILLAALAYSLVHLFATLMPHHLPRRYKPGSVRTGSSAS